MFVVNAPLGAAKAALGTKSVAKYLGLKCLSSAQAVSSNGLGNTVRDVIKFSKKIFEGYSRRGDKTGSPKELEYSRPQIAHQINRHHQISKAYHQRCIKFSNHAKQAYQQRNFGKLVSNSLALRYITKNLKKGGVNLSLVGFVSIALSQDKQSEHDHFDKWNYEGLSNRIKETFKSDENSFWKLNENTGNKVKNFEFGKIIDKGCNAAVYEGRYKDAEDDISDFEVLEVCETESDTNSQEYLEESSEELVTDESFEIISEEEGAFNVDELEIDILPLDVPTQETQKPQFDLAVKVIFNYDAESNFSAVMQSFEKEALPARMISEDVCFHSFGDGPHARFKSLPPHPNIVDMAGVFVDEMPELEDAMKEFPDALPERLNPDGSGRNMTVYLVMKRYDTTLRKYLSSEKLSISTACSVFAQLLEGVVHMGSYGVAHRDLKTDNILLDLQEDSVLLAISDFGCCLAKEDGSLRLPYVTSEISKGGNPALMAPEISSCRPGKNAFLDYRKSDLWAAGALAYEIFGVGNSFYRKQTPGGKRLNSMNYSEEDLPTLPDYVPDGVQKIVSNLLLREPSERLPSTVAANAMHLLLYAPKELSSSKHVLPARWQVAQWLIALSLECKLKKTKESATDYLKRSFLARLNFDEVMEAIYFLKSE